MREKKWLLGYTKKSYYETREPVYLYDFSWSCGWYWGGGYIGNANFHAHFDGAFLDASPPGDHIFSGSPARNGVAIWEDLGFFLSVPKYDKDQWWRIKELYKQFYALRAAAEVFQFGGHCTPAGRNPLEINTEMAAQINDHIKTVIIPEIRKALNKEKG